MHSEERSAALQTRASAAKEEARWGATNQGKRHRCNPAEPRESTDLYRPGQVGGKEATKQASTAEQSQTAQAGLSAHSGPSWQRPTPGDCRLYNIARGTATPHVVPLLLSSLRIKAIGFINTHRNNMAHDCMTTSGGSPQVVDVSFTRPELYLAA